MPGVKANFDVGISATQEINGDLGNPTVSIAASKSIKFAEGNLTTSQTDVLFSDTRTLAASASEDLDLRGVLIDSLGQTVNFAEVVAIYVEAASTNTNDIVLGGAPTNAFVGPFGAATHTVRIQPGEFAAFSSRNGWTVTAGTGDLLRVANGGAGSQVRYNIVLVGRTIAA